MYSRFELTSVINTTPKHIACMQMSPISFVAGDVCTQAT